MEGVSIQSIQTQVSYAKNSSPHRALRKLDLEAITAEFLKQAEDYAVKVLQGTQTQLLKDLEAKDLLIISLKARVEDLERAIAEMKRAAASADAGRNREILRRAGVVHGE